MIQRENKASGLGKDCMKKNPLTTHLPSRALSTSECKWSPIFYLHYRYWSSSWAYRIDSAPLIPSRNQVGGITFRYFKMRFFSYSFFLSYCRRFRLRLVENPRSTYQVFGQRLAFCSRIDGYPLSRTGQWSPLRCCLFRKMGTGRTNSI